MKLKRIMAFTLAACLMTSSMTVFAANYDGTNGNTITKNEETNGNDYVGGDIPTVEDYEDITGFTENDTWTDTSNNDKKYTWNGTKWDEVKDEDGDGDGDGDTNTPSTSEEGSPSDTVSVPDTVTAAGTVSAAGIVLVPGTVLASAPAPAAPKTLSRVDIMNIVTRAETIAMQATARDEGFADMVDMQIAAAKNMSAGEYYNNAVVVAPGIEEATPVAQGGGIIINGVATNVMATISKVDVAFVDSVRASVEGTVLNVVDVRFPAVEATINFYMPGVTADGNIVAVQYVDGAWVDVEVAEVRADHVVLNLKQNGKVAFLAK